MGWDSEPAEFEEFRSQPCIKFTVREFICPRYHPAALIFPFGKIDLDRAPSMLLFSRAGNTNGETGTNSI